MLAGDLAPYTEGLVEHLSEQWASAPHILYVLGNHEFYGTEIDETRGKLATECVEAGIHLLDPGMVQIDGTRFIGATLWTDLLLEGKADEVGAHMRVSREISDFRGAIQHQGRDFPTGESVARHRAERAGERVVVITHHAPSHRSVRPWYKGDPFNCAFASDLDRLLGRYQPPLWIHGHMHDPVDEQLGSMRLVANPAGYRYERKKGFDPAFCVEFDDVPRHGIAPVHRSHPAHRYMRDGDGDGVVCEQAGGVTHMSPNRVVFEHRLEMRGC